MLPVGPEVGTGYPAPRPLSAAGPTSGARRRGRGGCDADWESREAHGFCRSSEPRTRAKGEGSRGASGSREGGPSNPGQEDASPPPGKHICSRAVSQGPVWSHGHAAGWAAHTIRPAGCRQTLPLHSASQRDQVLVWREAGGRGEDLDPPGRIPSQFPPGLGKPRPAADPFLLTRGHGGRGKRWCPGRAVGRLFLGLAGCRALWWPALQT